MSSNRNELGPTISPEVLSRVRKIVRDLDRSGNLLSLATSECAEVLRVIDMENEAWTVLLEAPKHEQRHGSDSGTT